MDPVCHTLVGGALAESGLKRRTRLGMATLLIGANAPDIDVFSHFAGSLAALDFRRGWTHGLLAVIVLPFILAACIMLWDRLSRLLQRSASPVRPREILLLSLIAIATHPLLDFCNTYGMRWLMPFVDRWQYADTLFIVDPWMWAALIVGIVVSRRLKRSGSPTYTRPSRLALGAIAGYIALMAGSGVWARSVVANELSTAGWASDVRFMVAPEPLNPFRRRVVIDDGRAYRVGTFRWSPQPEFAMGSLIVWKRADDPLARRAARTRDGEVFLQWARFPFFVVPSQSADSTVVHIVDARYTMEAVTGFGAVAVVLDGGE